MPSRVCPVFFRSVCYSALSVWLLVLPEQRPLTSSALPFLSFLLPHDLPSLETAFATNKTSYRGTAAICLSALLASLRVTGASMADQRVLFLGAGEAGTGIGELVALYLSRRHGMSLQQARRHCYFLDSKGLVCASRTDLQRHKQPFAHDVPPQRDLKSAIRALRPTALIGVSTIAGAFDQEVVEAMTALNDRPIIFPLSNPTSKSECTYEQVSGGALRGNGGVELEAERLEERFRGWSDAEEIDGFFIVHKAIQRCEVSQRHPV